MRRLAIMLAAGMVLGSCATPSGKQDPSSRVTISGPEQPQGPYRLFECEWNEGVHSLHLELELDLGSLRLPAGATLSLETAVFSTGSDSNPVEVPATATEADPSQPRATFELSVAEIPDKLNLIRTDLTLQHTSTLLADDIASLTLREPINLGLFVVEAADPEHIDGVLEWILRPNLDGFFIAGPTFTQLSIGKEHPTVGTATLPPVGDFPPRLRIFLGDLSQSAGPVKLQIPGWRVSGAGQEFDAFTLASCGA